jgi:hypothetical protein
MALTRAAARNEVTQWVKDFYTEYVRKNRYAKYMGKTSNNIIQFQEDLSTKKGLQIVFSLVNALSGEGVMGSETLEGAEEGLNNDGMAVPVKYIRNAVAVDDEEDAKTLIDFLKAAKPALMNWMMERTRTHIITAQMSTNGYAYLASQAVKNPVYSEVATETIKDAWLAANSDRVLFGSAKSNNSANDHSASLANIDNTNDKMSPSIGRLAKRMAQAASPKIHPTIVEDEREQFVFFLNANAWRDFSQNSETVQTLRDAGNRGAKNRLFTAGDIIMDNIIYREIPEIPNIGLVGAGSIQVGVNFFCGVQDVGHAVAVRPTPISDTRDFGFVKGAGIKERRGTAKLMFKDPDSPTTLKDHGQVTVYAASVDDV